MRSVRPVQCFVTPSGPTGILRLNSESDRRILLVSSEMTSQASL